MPDFNNIQIDDRTAQNVLVMSCGVMSLDKLTIIATGDSL